MKQEVWWVQSSYENMGCDILENTTMTYMQLQHSRCYTVQRCRERGFKGFGRTPLSNQDLIIASYLGSFSTKPSQV